jgi:hypothetical protein
VTCCFVPTTPLSHTNVPNLVSLSLGIFFSRNPLSLNLGSNLSRNEGLTLL